MRAENSRQLLMKPHGGRKPDVWSLRCRHLAAAVGMDNDVLGKQGLKRGHVSRSRRREEGRGKLQPLFLADSEARPGLGDMCPRPAGKLTTGRCLATNCQGDLIEIHAEHVMQKKGGPLQR